MKEVVQNLEGEERGSWGNDIYKTALIF